MALRFVLLVDGEFIPAWQARALDLLLATGQAEPALVVVNGRARDVVRRSRWRQLLPRGHGLWQLFERLIARRSQSTRPTPLPPALADVPRLVSEARPEHPRLQSFVAPELDAIAAARPHFIIRFGFGILRGDILSAAPFGIWSYHHGDPADIRGQPPGFWELALGRPVTGVILQRLSADLDAGAILHQGWFRTVAHSYRRQRDQLYDGAAQFLARTCAAAAAGVLRERPQGALGPVLRKPTNSEFLRFLVTTARAVLAAHWTSLFVHQQWTVAVLPCPVQDAIKALCAEDQHAADAMMRLAPEAADAFCADPFASATAGGVRVFAERYPWRTGRGELVAIDHAADGSFSKPRAIWQPPFHCSYPYLFEVDGERWCVPEAAAAGETRAFPFAETGLPDFDVPGWLLLPEGVIDPTLVRHEGRVWMFGARPDHANTVLDLFVFDPANGKWEPHRLNPIKTDVRGARPAGRPFMLDGQLIRPAQDCARHYGAAIRLQRVVTLTPDRYEEEELAVIHPRAGRYGYGLHTLSWDAGWTVIDVARRAFIWREFLRAAARKLRLPQR